MRKRYFKEIWEFSEQQTQVNDKRRVLSLNVSAIDETIFVIQQK